MTTKQQLLDENEDLAARAMLLERQRDALRSLFDAAREDLRDITDCAEYHMRAGVALEAGLRKQIDDMLRQHVIANYGSRESEIQALRQENVVLKTDLLQQAEELAMYAARLADASSARHSTLSGLLSRVRKALFE